MENNLKQVIYELKDKMQILQLLNDEELDRIVPCFKKVDYPAGSTIFNEDDPGDFIGFVISGKLEVKKQTEFKGRQMILAILSKGSFAGELSMIDGQPRSASVAALEDSSLLILSRKALNFSIEQYPDTGIKILKGIIRTMSIRMRKYVERLANIF